MAKDDCDQLGDEDAIPNVEFDPALDDHYQLIADCNRRAILYLLDRSNPRKYSVSTLAATIAQLDPQGRSATPSEIEIELRHKHLPQLADMGVIEYDDRNDEFVYTGQELTERVLEPAAEHEVTDR